MNIDPLTPEQAQQQAAQEELQRQAREEAKRRAHEKAESDLYASAAAELNTRVEHLGYKRMSVTDFVLDAKDLQSSGTRVAVHGIYLRENGGTEWLTKDGYPNEVSSAPLITADASRGLRKYFATQGMPAGSTFPIGTYVSNVWLMGTAVACKGGIYDNDRICLKVANGWSLHGGFSYVPDDLRYAQ